MRQKNSKKNIIDHTHRAYRNMRNAAGANKWNGAYYYSKEIVRNIIPRVQTDRAWVTIMVKGHAFDHCIFFVHNNIHINQYEWLKEFNDVVLVCGVPETVDKVKHIGKAIYLPLSIDVEDVQQYMMPKTKDVAFAGRPSKKNGMALWGVECIEGLDRPKFLQAMAEHKRIYAVGRCAIEAKALGCEILPYDPRYPDPEIWQVIDNKDAAEILQAELDRIDG